MSKKKITIFDIRMSNYHIFLHRKNDVKTDVIFGTIVDINTNYDIVYVLDLIRNTVIGVPACNITKICVQDNATKVASNI